MSSVPERAGRRGRADDPGEARVRGALPARAHGHCARTRHVGRARGRPEARADRGLLELGPARLRGGPGGAVEIRYELSEDRLTVEVTDEGSGFDPDVIERAQEELDEGGLGIAIIRAVTDDLEIGVRARGAAPGCASRSTSRRQAPSVFSAAVQLQTVNVGSKLLGDYVTIATRGLMDQIRALAEPLAGKRVLHLSATAFGGGVAEILYTLVPLMRDAGSRPSGASFTAGRVLRRDEGDPQRPPGRPAPSPPTSRRSSAATTGRTPRRSRANSTSSSSTTPSPRR